MSNPNPKRQVGRPFQPGNPGGPGRPRGIDPKLSDYNKNLTKVRVIAMLSDMLDCDQDQLDAVLADRKTPALKAAIASVISACIKQGDYSRLEMLLNRTIGKVKDESVIETKNHDETLSKVPREKIVELLRSASGNE